MVIECKKWSWNRGLWVYKNLKERKTTTASKDVRKDN